MSRVGFRCILVLTAVGCVGAASTDPDEPNQRSSDVASAADIREGGSDVMQPEPACPFEGDGECDEPVNCPLLTDMADCAAACDEPERLWQLGAACAARQPPSALDPPAGARPSGGTVHTVGTHDRTVMVPLGDDPGSRPRHYRLFVPPNYRPDRAWPLVIMLPGHRVDIYSLADYTGLEADAEANGFLLAYAEQQWRGPSLRWAWWTDWDWTQSPNVNPDLTFIDQLIEDAGGGWNVDLSRVYAVGHSRGGAMAFILALERPERVAAVCSQSGFTEFGYDQRAQAYAGDRKTPVMLVHGTLDSDVPVSRSDQMNAILTGLGWDEVRLRYDRLDGVAHRWQPWLNQEMWDFLSSHTLPGGAP